MNQPSGPDPSQSTPQPTTPFSIVPAAAAEPAPGTAALLSFGLAAILNIEPDTVTMVEATSDAPPQVLIPTDAVEALNQAKVCRDPRLTRLFDAAGIADLTEYRHGSSPIFAPIKMPSFGGAALGASPGQAPESWKRAIFNGVFAETGGYAVPPMNENLLASLALDAPTGPNTTNTAQAGGKRKGGTLGLKYGVDPTRLDQAGWGVIFPAEGFDPKIEQALQPLLDLRKAQAGDRFKIYKGEHGYHPGESKEHFLAKNGMAAGPVDPERVPYYLLIVGSPEQIPFPFQYELDIQYAVGRIDFQNPDDYAAYAENVVAAEKGGTTHPKSVRFFAPNHAGDDNTNLSTHELVIPLAQKIASAKPIWDIAAVTQADATKSRLHEMLGGAETPAFLFTASHGVMFSKNNPRQQQCQGALLCHDWPGPMAPPKPLAKDHYFTGGDLEADASLSGLISFQFACFSAGTPRYNTFSEYLFKSTWTLTKQPFTAQLPARMLSLKKGALAVIGHVDQCFPDSFFHDIAQGQLTVFEDAILRLLDGQPVGAAMEGFNQRYAELAGQLAGQLTEVGRGKLYRANSFSKILTAHGDARGYVVLGDPAVRLPAAMSAT